LLDTSIVSEPAKTRAKSGTLERLMRHGGASAICAPVWVEVLFGCERMPRGKRRSEVEDYLTGVVRQMYPILPYDEAAATWHASERVRLERAGKTSPFIDGQIAAIAEVRGLTVVTANVEDFRAFDVRVETW
jgi:tRNA(fMet)-specific endonuclease VapC